MFYFYNTKNKDLYLVIVQTCTSAFMQKTQLSVFKVDLRAQPRKKSFVVTVISLKIDIFL